MLFPNIIVWIRLKSLPFGEHNMQWTLDIDTLLGPISLLEFLTRILHIGDSWI